MEAIELAEVIGRNARRIRTEAGATLDAVGKAARQHGLASWGGTRVSDFENGRVSPTVPTLVAVCLALGEIRRSPLTLAELLAHDGTVAINGGLAIRGAALGRFLDGEPVRLTKRDVPGLPDVDTAALAGHVRQAFEKLNRLPARLKDVEMARAYALKDRSGEAEQRIAKALGVDLLAVAVASTYLYDSTASEERDRRAGAEATAQKRGRITREIRTELEGVLNGDN